MLQSDEILKGSSSVLLVDWPSATLPRALLETGLTVFGYSPAGYSSAELADEKPDDLAARSFVPERPEEGRFLVFRRLSEAPARVDVVGVYRPSEELPEIIKRHVTPLQARMLWLQPPVVSPQARDLAARLGVEFVEGADLAEAARRVRARATT